VLPTIGTTLLTLGAVAFAFTIGVGPVIARRLAIVLTPMAIALLAMHGWLIARPDDIPLGPLALSPSGAAFGVRVLTRIATILTASLLFVATTHPGDLLKSLDALGVPTALGYLIASPLLLLTPLSVRAKEISDAQRARGLDISGNPARRLAALPALLIPTITLALTDLDHRTLVLTGRAFRTRRRRTVLDPPADSRRERDVRLGLLTLAVLQLGLLAVWH
jgi:energy-coupling factor transport system permease protein